jgi:hypothetical protein
VPTKWVREDGTDLIVEEASGLSADARRFFTRYQRAFSWGRDGRQSAQSWFEQLDSLPANVRRYLREKMGMLLPEKHDEKQALARYTVTRHIKYHQQLCLMPIIELINHAPRAPLYGIGDGIRVAGQFDGEILVCYSRSDSFLRLFEYGFVCDEKSAFSLPMNLPAVGDGVLSVGKNAMATQGAQGVPSLLPTVKYADGAIEISHLLLGFTTGPRIPRSIFRRTLPRLSLEQADEVFQRIAGYNINVLVGLLGELEGQDCQMCRQLGSVVRMQLSAIASSYGVRDLDSLFNSTN